MSDIFVKICGITNLDDAVMCVEAGADALGFNFYPVSPRYIDPMTARDIIARIGAQTFAVGVFVNNDAEEIARIRREAGISAVQLHGDETLAEAASIEQFLGCDVIKAVRLSPANDIFALESYTAGPLLIDSYTQGVFGGSGTMADWSAARKLVEAGLRIFLAGGLTPENIQQAVREVRPFGVDVASGVESSPGRKDPDKVRDFIDKARNA